MSKEYVLVDGSFNAPAFDPLRLLEIKLKEQGVEFVFVKKNLTLDNINDEVEMMSVSVFTKGGSDIDIAKILYLHKPPGIKFNGDFTVYVEDMPISWFNLNYTNYNSQNENLKMINKALEKEYLLKRLAELGD